MATAEGNSNKSSVSEAQAASSDKGTAEPQESLEDLLRSLNREIKNSDWLEKNTADKWLSENPQAAKELQYLVDAREADRTSADQPSCEAAKKE